jgi:hypothetical protein
MSTIYTLRISINCSLENGLTVRHICGTLPSDPPNFIKLFFLSTDELLILKAFPPAINSILQRILKNLWTILWYSVRSIPVSIGN